MWSVLSLERKQADARDDTNQKHMVGQISSARITTIADVMMAIPSDRAFSANRDSIESTTSWSTYKFKIIVMF